MSETLTFFIIAIICLIVGAVLGMFIANLKKKSELGGITERLNQEEMKVVELRDAFAKAQQETTQLRSENATQIEKLRSQFGEEINTVRKEKDFFQNELTARNVAFENLESRMNEKTEELEKLQEKFTKDFEIVAQKILDDKSNKFTLQNKQNLDIILKPLQEKIQHFEKRVEETNKEAIDRTSALREQIKGLTALNEQMSKEANNLTKALKGDSKTQGNWGELVLERVLEKSGLEKDREYFLQQSFTNEDGNRVLPDVVIHLPDNKKMIVDSKVSLRAYERYVNEEDPHLRDGHLKEHVNALKRHVVQLGAKNYHDLYQIESPDFVLLFIPIEPAFAIAINSDNQLYNQAFEKNIVIVTPSTLLATLRTIDSMWNNEKQQQNALEIATQAGRLYDQFVNLTDDLIKVGNQLRTVQGSYDGTMKKLTGQGNLIKKVEKLKKLGIKQKKHINEKLVERATGDDTLSLEE
ncbi:DNA recombination protein RmuC [Dokdonia sinensis]|uniref:DNA recombination protein RmuC n=1 Tax=Dokdonia sinensis TaxID=2479847 RepID=A0A3M0G7V4_9FLAO|nr:DNA recombination protein RmuC [Dokdonia sinensis]RMB61045.1 DNA recombination protein RmuC [Dokdonia sinensis]